MTMMRRKANVLHTHAMYNLVGKQISYMGHSMYNLRATQISYMWTMTCAI